MKVISFASCVLCNYIYMPLSKLVQTCLDGRTPSALNEVDEANKLIDLID